jgi:hypothetical protein
MAILHGILFHFLFHFLQNLGGQMAAHSWFPAGLFPAVFFFNQKVILSPKNTARPQTGCFSVLFLPGNLPRKTSSPAFFRGIFMDA